MRVRDDRGSVLVLAMAVALLLVAIGLAALWLSAASTRVSANIARRQEALLAAETGVERARSLLTASPQWAPLLSPGGCGATLDAPERHGVVLCEGASALEHQPGVPPSSHAAKQAPGLARTRYTVWLRNDRDEYRRCNGVVESGEVADDGDCDGDGVPESAVWRATHDGDWRVLVHVEGTARDQLTTVALEVVLVRRFPPDAGIADAGASDAGATGDAGVPRTIVESWLEVH